MNPKVRILRIFARIWLIASTVILAVGLAGIVLFADSFWEGVSKLIDVMSPFNIWNYIAALFLFAPGIFAYCWLDRLKVAEPPSRTKEFFRTGILVLLVGGVVGWFGFLFTLSTTEPTMADDEFGRKFFQSAKSLQGHPRCLQVKRGAVGLVSGGCDSWTIPNEIEVGLPVEINDKPYVVRFITGTYFPDGLPNYGVRPGQWACYGANKLEDFPREDDKTRIWIAITDCQPGPSVTR